MYNKCVHLQMPQSLSVVWSALRKEIYSKTKVGHSSSNKITYRVTTTRTAAIVICVFIVRIYARDAAIVLQLEPTMGTSVTYTLWLPLQYCQY